MPAAMVYEKSDAAPRIPFDAEEAGSEMMTIAWRYEMAAHKKWPWGEISVAMLRVHHRVPISSTIVNSIEEMQIAQSKRRFTFS